MPVASYDVRDRILMRMLKFLLIAAVILALLAGALLFTIKRADLGAYRVPLQNFVERETGRKLRIDGDFEPALSLTPAIRATNVQFANPSWADSESMLRIDEVYFQMRLSSLFSGPLQVIKLRAHGGELHLQRTANGQNNWTFERPDNKTSPSEERGEKSFVTLTNIDVSDLRVTYSAPERDNPVDANITSLAVAAQDMRTNQISVDGTLHGTPLRASGTIPRLAHMINGAAYNDLQIEYGDLRISSKLDLDNIEGLKGLDGTVEVKGRNLEKLTKLLGLRKLDDGPFNLATTLREDNDAISFDGKLEAQTGKLTANGSLKNWADKPAIAADLTLAAPDILPLARYMDLPLEKSGPLDAHGGIRWGPGTIEFSSFEATFDSNVVNLDGAVGLPARPDNTTLKIRSKGPNIAATMALVNLKWRITYDYEFAADFSGSEGMIVMQPVSLRVGGNDFAGRVTVVPGKKPIVEADLHSKQILIGDYLEDRRQPRLQDKDATLVFDTKPFDFSALDGFDLQAKVAIDHIVASNTDIQDTSMEIVVKDGSLNIEPFKTMINGGPLSGRMRLDSAGEAPLFQIELSGDKIRYARTKEVTPDEMALIPPNTLNTRIKASGNSLHEMAVSADGWIKIVSEAGRRPRGSFGLFTNNVLDEVYYKLQPIVKKRPYHQLGCGIYYVRFDNGKAKVEPFLLQTDSITVRAHGTVQMEDEKLDFDFAAKPRKGVGLGVASIASPFLAVRGTLAHPQVGADVAGGVVSGAAAFFTMGLSVVGKGLMDRAAGGRDLCPDIDKILKKYRAGEETDAIWENEPG